MLAFLGLFLLSSFAVHKLVAQTKEPQKVEKKADVKPAADAKAPAEKTAAADKKADKKDGGAETSADVGTHKADGLFPEKEFYTKAEVEALREVLDKKTTQLDQDIDTQKKYVDSLKGQVEEHLKKVEAARNEIADFMNSRDEKEEGKLKKLAKFYEAMDAEQAAPHLKDVNDELAIKIFDRMDVKKAGQILAQMPGQRAAKLTTLFPKLRLQAERAAVEAKK